MNTNRQEKLERLLRNGKTPEPPANLLDSIKNEIPAELPRTGIPLHRRTSHVRTWSIAASVLFLIGFGYIAFQVGGMYEVRKGPDFSAPTRTAVYSKAEAPAKKNGKEAPELDAASAQVAPTEAAPQAAVLTRQKAMLKDDSNTSSAANKLAAGVEGGVAGGVETEAVRGDLEGVVNQTYAAPAAPPPPPPAASSPEPKLRAEEQAQPAEGRRALIGSIIMAEGDLAKRPEPGRDQSPSTGGTLAPNDEPYADTFYRSYGTNPFVDAEDDPLSTFGLDVDTASYSVARRYLSDGHLPPAASVRPEEFLNYFNYGDAPPQRGDFAIHSEAATPPYPTGPHYAMIRFGIRARDVSAANRAPAVLTFVVDTSGSMARQNRLGLMKQSLNLLLDEMREEDRIGLVSFGSTAEVLVEPTSDHDLIRRAIARLAPDGSTNAAAGLRLGYETAVGAFRRGSNNRVIFVSDGVANVGTTSAEGILEQVDQFKERGIMLNTIGVGMGNFNDVLLEQLANRGNGTYAYIDDISEAERVFSENLSGTIQTVAEAARVQVRFNPRAVARYRLVGYENRDVADQRFRDDTVDGGEVGAGHTVTALYEVKLQPETGRNEEVARLTLRYRPQDQGRFREMEEVVDRSEIRTWEESSPRFKLATLVAAFAESLKQSYWARHIDAHDLAARIRNLTTRFRGDKDVVELAKLSQAAAALRGQPAPAPDE